MVSEKSPVGYYFLGIVVLLFIIVTVINPNSGMKTLEFLSSLLLKIVPILFVVFIIMFLINYFVSPKKLVDYRGRR